ncbi:MAG: DUF4332 domain-containing protein, partial [Anaerolineae bacterium]
PLPQFRDKYVDTTKSHLIVRVYSAKDNQGQHYRVMLQPAPAPPSSGPEGRAEDRLASTSLTIIKGIGRKTAALLQQTGGVDSVETFLEAGATSAGRATLTRQTGKPKHVILRWVQLADLMRIGGIGEDYSMLLWQTGITAIPELGNQNPQALETLLENFNQRRKVVNRLPSSEQIRDWVAQAQRLPPVVKT